MIFSEEYDSPIASYVKLDKNGFVTESAEKVPISKTATVGLHYFKRGSDFVRYANEMIKANLNYKNEFYVTPVYNFFAKAEKKIITFPVSKMYALGDEKEIKLFENEYNSKNKK